MKEQVVVTVAGDTVTFEGNMQRQAPKKKREERYHLNLDLGNMIEIGAAGTGYLPLTRGKRTMVYKRRNGVVRGARSFIEEVRAFVLLDHPDVVFKVTGS